MDRSLPRSSVHGISQARVLEWVAISSSKGLSQPSDTTWVSCVSCIAGRFITSEITGKPHIISGNHIENIMERNSLNNIIFETNITRSIEDLYETTQNFTNDSKWCVDPVFSYTSFLNRKTRHCENTVLGWAVLSRISCVWLFVTPWTEAHQGPLSMGFSRQEHWGGLPSSVRTLFLSKLIHWLT